MEALDIVEHVRAGLVAVAIDVAVGPFDFQRRKEALHRRTVPDVSGPAHRTGAAVVGQQALKLLAGVLRSLVRVMQPGVGTNRYSSAFNDPVNKLDPEGNAAHLVVIAAAAAIAWAGSWDYANAPTSGAGGDGGGGGSDTYSRSTLDMASTMVGGAGAPAARGIFRETRELARRGAERFPHASAAASAALAIDSMGEPGGGFGAGRVVRNTVSSAPNRIVPGGGLQAHEAAGGHLISRHIGKSDADLGARLSSQPNIKAASSFPDLATAERAVSSALDANAANIYQFLNGTGGRLAINHNVGSPVGNVMSRGATTSAPSSNVRVIIQRDATMPTGYRIATGFPVP